jgi:hypothetical protein
MIKKLILSFGGLILLIMFTSCPSGPNFYARVLIETFPFDSTASSMDTILTLYDSSGTQIAYDDDNPDVPFDHSFSARIDYENGLDPGIYYIKVTADGLPGVGPYVIRALSLAIGESVPAYSYPGVPGDDSGIEPIDDTDSGNIPDNPINMGLGNANQKNRYMDSETDVDWLRLDLP